MRDAVNHILRMIVVGSCGVFVCVSVRAQVRTKPGVRADIPMIKSVGTPIYAVLSINNLTTWMRYDGHSNHSPSGDDGLYYPRGTGSVVYQDGVVWGGKVFRNAAYSIPYSSSQYDQNIRVGGGTYGIGTKGGSVVGFGSGAIAENINTPNVRIYRIRRDYASMTGYELYAEAQAVNEIYGPLTDFVMMDQVYAQYAKDWSEWPTQKGAPYIDRNHNGVYDSPPAFNTDPSAGTLFIVDSLISGNYDEPGIAGADLSLPADQVIWTVFNDLDVTTSQAFLGSLPIGLEVQKTVWGYKQNLSHGNFYFQRHLLINKGGVDTSETTGNQKGTFWIDSMYIAQWSDPDIGQAGDDLVGCDTIRNLGYAYNGNLEDEEFALFNLPPPAVGYDIMGGPVVPSVGDSGIVDLIYRKDIRNLPMNSFTYVTSNPSGPPTGPPTYLTDTGQWWKLLRGFVPIGSLSTSDQYYNFPPELGPSRYVLSGDPVSRSGWVDGLGETYSFPPGDRRLIASVGPFRLAPDDTQELYVGVVIGMGIDRLSSIAAMRATDRAMQSNFDHQFQVPVPPDTPAVKATALNRSIILEWGSNPKVVQSTENKLFGNGYAFEGYIVYQLPTGLSPLTDGIRIATFDRKNGLRDIVQDQFDMNSGFIIPRLLQAGNDQGIRRSICITNDILTEKQSNQVTPLSNGHEYVFAVTAYNVNPRPDAYPVSLESRPVIVKVKPQIPFGRSATQPYGDTLAITRVAGSGTGTITPIVVDPLGGTGETYRLTFQPSPSDSLVWSLENRTLGTNVVSAQLLMSSNEEPPIVEAGINLGVYWTAGTFSPADTFEYTVSAPVAGHAVEIESINRVGVFPNPYYAEISGWNSPGGQPRQHVTFNNLPQRAVIRIFNLAGHLVRTLRKDDASQFFEWDLMNEDGWLVASGIYICHVELIELQTTKLLKLAIITAL